MMKKVYQILKLPFKIYSSKREGRRDGNRLIKLTGIHTWEHSRQ